jgi:hypothetical protein
MSETRSAAEAFDALRAEVRETHAEIRTLTTRIAGASAPNYDLTLGEMAKRLGAMEDRLIHLAHRMPPARLPGELVLPDELAAITEQARATAQALRAATGVAVAQQSLRWWMIGSGGIGVLLGVLLCLGTAALLPRQAGAWMAATIIGGDPWAAGENLMQESNATAFDRMARLYQACPADSSTDLCVAAIAVKAAKSP